MLSSKIFVGHFSSRFMALMRLHGQDNALVGGIVSVWYIPNIRINEKLNAWDALLIFRGEVSEK